MAYDGPRFVECVECDKEFDLANDANWATDAVARCPHCGEETHGATFSSDPEPRDYYIND